MSLFIKDENTFQCMPMSFGSFRGRWEVRSLDFIPQKVREWPSQFKIDVSDNPHFYMVYAKLPDVELKNLWIYIEGRTLTLYAGRTGEKQENGEYHYIERPFGWFKGEITLPERIHQRPTMASFNSHFLFMSFIEKADVSS